MTAKWKGNGVSGCTYVVEQVVLPGSVENNKLTQQRGPLYHVHHHDKTHVNRTPLPPEGISGGCGGGRGGGGDGDGSG